MQRWRKNIQLSTLLKILDFWQAFSYLSCRRTYNYSGRNSALPVRVNMFAAALSSVILPSAVTPISTPGCLYQFGIYPESDQCSKNYLKCAYGMPHTTPCEPGLAYDDKTHSCNWPDLLDFCSPEGNSHVSKCKQLTYNKLLSLTQHLVYVWLT